jgi:hypothetical protein
LAYILNRYARPDAPEDWDAIRDEMEKAAAHRTGGSG